MNQNVPTEKTNQYVLQGDEKSSDKNVTLPKSNIILSLRTKSKELQNNENI